MDGRIFCNRRILLREMHVSTDDNLSVQYTAQFVNWHQFGSWAFDDLG